MVAGRLHGDCTLPAPDTSPGVERSCPDEDSHDRTPVVGKAIRCGLRRFGEIGRRTCWRRRTTNVRCDDRLTMRGKRTVRSDGFFDQPGPQTTGAHTDAQGRTVHECLHALQVGIEDAPGLVVCVADIISGLMFFSTEITGKCHGPTPLLRRRSTTGPWIGRDATIAPRVMTSCSGG